MIGATDDDERGDDTFTYEPSPIRYPVPPAVVPPDFPPEFPPVDDDDFEDAAPSSELVTPTEEAPAATAPPTPAPAVPAPTEPARELRSPEPVRETTEATALQRLRGAVGLVVVVLVASIVLAAVIGASVAAIAFAARRLAG